MQTQSIDNLKQLANFLRCQEEFLNRFLQDGPTLFDLKDPKDIPDYETLIYGSAVEIFYLPKRNRALGYRKVHAVRTENLRSALIVLNSNLYLMDRGLDCVHGFTIGKNIRTNSQNHLAKNHLLSVDIMDFFETITIAQVRTCLEAKGFSALAAEVLSKLTTINGYLPQGYHTSPILSNFVAKKMDQELLNLCGDAVTYTRYADDLYFSSNATLPELSEIQQVIEFNGFKLHDKKTRYMKRGQKQYVTGLTVFDNSIPRIPKKIKMNIRLELHYIRKYGYLNHALRYLHYTFQDYISSLEIQSEVRLLVKATKMRLIGWLRFIYSVEPVTAKKYQAILAKCED